MVYVVNDGATPQELGQELIKALYPSNNYTTEQILDLIARGADVNAADQSKETPMHVLARNKNKEGDVICKALLDAGANFLAVNMHGNTPMEYVYSDNLAYTMMYAAKAAFEERAKKLADMLVAKSSDNTLMKQLIAEGIQVDKRASSHSCTLLGLAVKADNFEICKALVKAGADVKVKDSNGYMPRGYAVRNSMIASYLDAREVKPVTYWTIFDDQSVAEITTNSLVKLQLCSIFNMVSRERTVVTQTYNPAVPVHHTAPQSFDDLPQNVVDKAIDIAQQFELDVDFGHARKSNFSKTTIKRLG